MARLRRNKERPPQTIHINVTLEQAEALQLSKKEKSEPYYKVLERIFLRMQELEFINDDLKHSLKESRELRQVLELKIEDLQRQIYEQSRPLPRFTK